jgi:hypothetical protein
VESAGLAVVVPGQVTPDAAVRALDSAEALLRDFGGIPEEFARSVVFVFVNATDTAAALAASVAQGRRRVPIGGIQLTERKGGGSAYNVSGLIVASAVAVAYRDARGGDWRAWLPGDYGIGPWGRGAMWSAFGSLARSRWLVGSRCLAGDVAGCRLWLGVDREASPYQARYRAEELRDYLDDYGKWMAQRSPAGRDCLSGAASACFAYALEEHHPFPAVPADETGRRSLVRAVRALHGAEALQRALGDTTGSVGERFARAAGIGVDSLMSEWRHWVLTRGGRPRDRNLVADAAPAVLLAGLLLVAARRSRG